MKWFKNLHFVCGIARGFGIMLGPFYCGFEWRKKDDYSSPRR